MRRLLSASAMMGGVVALYAAVGVSEAQTIREACAADAARLCPGATDAEGRKQCLSAHKSELSQTCLKSRSAAAGGPAGAAAPVGKPASASAATAPDGGLDTIAARLAGHGYPSTFVPWFAPTALRKSDGASTPLASLETRIDSLARFDVVWVSWPALGLKPTPGHEYPQLGPEFTPESLAIARRNRARLLALNPNLVLLVDAHYHSARDDVFPPDSPWWLRNTQWERDIGYKFHAHRLDFSNPQLQDSVAAHCGAMVKTGLFDGCMLDWWNDADQSADRLALIKKVRAAVGEKAILLGNVNGRLPTRTAPYLNGVFREGFGANYFPDWRMAASDLLWDESHLRKPAISALEGFSAPGREEFQRMREVTTLSLVFSNGSAFYTPVNPSPPPTEFHYWYPFWDKSLGRPVGALASLDRPDLQGAYTRQYEKGEVVFNPPTNHAVTVSFPEARRSAATGAVGRSFTVAAGDGDLFLTTR